MGAPKSAVTKATERIREEAQQMDLRRQAQVQRQVEIIDRLMDGGTYDDILQSQTETIADLRVRLEASEAENSRLRAAQQQED